MCIYKEVTTIYISHRLLCVDMYTPTLRNIASANKHSMMLGATTFCVPVYYCEQ